MHTLGYEPSHRPDRREATVDNYPPRMAKQEPVEALPFGANPLRSDQLDAFIVFAEHLNFRKAAEALFLDQPALHARITKLQKKVGARLYETERQRVTRLTAEGATLLEYAKSAQRSADDALLEIRGSHGGPLRLAAGRGAYLYVLPSAVEALTTRAGGVVVSSADNDEAIDAVRSGAADVGVIAGIGPPDDLDHYKLKTFRQMLVVKHSHRLGKRKTLKIKDLDQVRLVLPPTSEPHRQWLDAAFDRREIQVRVEAEAIEWDLLVKFVEFGVPGTIINEFFSLPDGLVGIPIADAPSVTYHLIWRKVRRELAAEVREAFTKNSL